MPEQTSGDPRWRRHVLQPGHRQPALRHGPQPRGTPSGHLRPELQSNLERSFRGVGHQCLQHAAAAASASLTTMCSAMTTTEPRPGCCSISSTSSVSRASSAIEIGYLGSRSYQLERMFDRNEVHPRRRQHAGPGGRTGSSPGCSRSATSPKRGTTARWPADPAPEQRVLGTRRLHALEVDRQRQRYPHAQRRRAVPAEQQLRGG